MAELRKFLFDNFVIEEKKKNKPEAVIEPEPETPPVAEPEPVVEPEEPKEEITEVEYEAEPLPPEQEIKNFTEEEDAEKLKAEEKEAYERGLQTARDGIESTMAALLENIGNKLTTLIADSSKAEENAEQEAFALARAVVEKLVPNLTAENAAEIVKKFIAENFNSFKNEAKLSFYIHPDIISYVQETIAKLANSYDFEGKISLHKDASIEKSDCRVEWENGGVERNSAALGEKIKDMLADKPEGKKNDE